MSGLNAKALVEAIEGSYRVSMFAPVEINDIGNDGPLRVMLSRFQVGPALYEDRIVITNDPAFPGEQLWPAS